MMRTLARAPRVTVWGRLMALAQMVRFTGFMTLLIAMGGEAGARVVIDHEEAEER